MLDKRHLFQKTLFLLLLFLSICIWKNFTKTKSLFADATFHNDIQRTGFFSSERLTPSLWVKWRINLSEREISFSSPIVWNNVVYVAAKNNIYAINATNGRKRWEFHTTKAPFSFSTPTIYHGILYIGSANYYVYALDAVTGDLKWQFKSNERCTGSPLLSKNTVYITGDSGILALDAKSGKLIWKYETKNVANYAPALFNNIIYFGAGNNFYALDSKTALLKWKYKTKGPISASAVIDVNNKSIFIGCNDKNFYALNLVNGKLKWAYQTNGSISSSPVIAEGVVYVGTHNNSIYAIKASNGNLEWKSDVGSQLAGASSPVLTKDFLFIGTGPPHFELLALDCKGGQVKWRYRPRCSKLALFIRRLKNPLYIDAGGIVSSPFINKDTLYVTFNYLRYRMLYAFTSKPRRRFFSIKK